MNTYIHMYMYSYVCGGYNNDKEIEIVGLSMVMWEHLEGGRGEGSTITISNKHSF